MIIWCLRFQWWHSEIPGLVDSAPKEWLPLPQEPTYSGQIEPFIYATLAEILTFQQYSKNRSIFKVSEMVSWSFSLSSKLSLTAASQFLFYLGFYVGHSMVTSNVKLVRVYDYTYWMCQQTKRNEPWRNVRNILAICHIKVEQIFFSFAVGEIESQNKSISVPCVRISAMP